MSELKRPPRSTLQTVVTAVVMVAGAVLLALVILVGAAMFSVGSGHGNTADVLLPPGRALPPLRAEGWINGEPGDLTGTVTVVDAWFYGCGPCWRAAPEIAALHAKYARRGVAFIGLTPDPATDIDAVQQFIDRNGLKYPNGYGALQTLIDLDAQYFPAMWVVGRDGRVLWNSDQEHRQSLDDAIAAALTAP